MWIWKVSYWEDSKEEAKKQEIKFIRGSASATFGDVKRGKFSLINSQLI